MKLFCTKKKLLINISLVLRSINNKTTLNILECVLLIANEKGLVMIGNNLEMAIKTTAIEAEIFEDGGIALNAKMFYEIIKKLPEENITIESNKENIAIIISGKSKFKIQGMSADEFPFPEDIEKTTPYFIKNSDMKNLIKQTIFSVAVDDSKPVMMGELMEIEDDSIKMVAVDGFRISFSQILSDNSKNHNKKIVIPSKTLSELNKIIPNDNNNQIKFYFTDKHISFELENCIIVSRLLEGDFIKYENLFTDDYTTGITIKRLEFISSLERASLLSRESNKTPIKLEITDSNIIITSNTEIGTTYEEIDIMVDGTPIEIAFNPKYLIDALKAIEEDNVIIQLMTSLSPCIIKGVNNKFHKYLILPLRLK